MNRHTPWPAPGSAEVSFQLLVGFMEHGLRVFWKIRPFLDPCQKPLSTSNVEEVGLNSMAEKYAPKIEV